MPLFTWSDSYSVSVKSMDEQHKKLFTLINQLHDAMSAGKGKTIIGSVLNEMLDYTRTHFTAEEKVLEKLAYPGLAEQKKEHGIYINKIIEMQKKLEGGSLTVTMEASQFLRDWLTNHIMVVDKKYGSFLTEKGEK
jgi:hemerythrin